MALKGQETKEKLFNVLLCAFGENGFSYNDGKEIRFNAQENGEPVQIKIVLTASKTPVEAESESKISFAGGDAAAVPDSSELVATEEEKALVRSLMDKLKENGFI